MKTVFNFLFGWLKSESWFQKRMDYAKFIFEQMEKSGIQHYKDQIVEIKKEPRQGKDTELSSFRL